MTDIQARITKDKDIMGGLPCIAGTRIPVQVIKDLYKPKRHTGKEIMKLYPQLTEEQINAALSYKE